MDTTPIYTELQQKLIDPEANNWGPSDPPEFAAELSAHEEQPKSRNGSEGKDGSKNENGTKAGNSAKSENGSKAEDRPASENGTKGQTSNEAKKSGRSRGRRHRAED